MTGTFEIISDSMQPRRAGSGKDFVRVLALMDRDRPALNKSLDFVLTAEDETRFKEIFARECIGRSVHIGISNFLFQGFAVRVRCQGTVLACFDFMEGPDIWLLKDIGWQFSRSRADRSAGPWPSKRANGALSFSRCVTASAFIPTGSCGVCGKNAAK